MAYSTQMIFFRENRGQSTIEFIFVFILLATFLLGFSRLWVWYNAQFPHRQRGYSRTRIIAATPDDANPLGEKGPGLWPVFGNLPLTDDWLFAGIPPEEEPFKKNSKVYKKREGRTTLHTNSEITQKTNESLMLRTNAILLRREAKRLKAKSDFHLKKAKDYEALANKYKDLDDFESRTLFKYYKHLSQYHYAQAKDYARRAKNTLENAINIEKKSNDNIKELLT